MRLNEHEVREIKKAVRKHFGESAVVYLFGSRTYDAKRGGDIDLLVEHEPGITGSEQVKRKLKTMTDIQFSLGDQKIDIITTTPQTDVRAEDAEDVPLVIKNARREAVRL